MATKRLSAFVLFICWTHAEVKDPIDPVPGIKPFGFVALDYYIDSRQLIAARENFFLLFPAPYLPDVKGRDINKHGSEQITALQSRLGLTAIAPRRGKYLLNGLVEADFLGVSELSIDTLRLRHACGTLATKNWSLLFGQFWHALFALDCFPDTISFNNGAPVEPQARAPQIRFTWTPPKWQVLFTAHSQRSFNSVGPVGSSTVYFRNGLMPNFNFHVRRLWSDKLVSGVSVDVKRLVPRLVTDKNVKTDASIVSGIAEIYTGYNTDDFMVRGKFVYSQNGSEQGLISGYGVRTLNATTDIRTYTNTQAVGAWLDTAVWFGRHDNVKKSVGLFIGYTKNIGSNRPLYIDPTTNQPIVYAIAPTVDYEFRIEPRFRYFWEPLHVGLEFEYSRSAFGTINRWGRINNPCPVANKRLLMEVLYLF